MRHIGLTLLIACLGVLLLASVSRALEPGVCDITMLAGADYCLQLTLSDCADDPPPVPPAKCQVKTPMNLAGYSYKAQFRQAPAPAGKLFANYSTKIVNSDTGRLDVCLSRSQTTTNSGNSGGWDLQQTSSGGLVNYILTGKSVVKPTFTRP